MKFGRLTVLLVYTDPHKSRSTARRATCLCDCGTRKSIIFRHIKTGAIKSCGCLSREATARMGRACKTHGMKKTAEYAAWQSMKSRCYNKNGHAYHRYGGRGIYTCRQWKKSFVQFLKDMGKRPSCRHSLDRIDNDGPYSPQNCRWALRKIQSRNTSTNRPITWRGKSATIPEWSEILGIRTSTIRERLRYGWPIERALT